MRKTAPKRNTFVAVTAPVSRDRIEAIKEAKTAGQMFFATGGRHLNSNKLFQAQAMRKREAQIVLLEATKKERLEALEAAESADVLLQAKGLDLTPETFTEFTVPEIKILLKWTNAKAAGPNKPELVDAYYNAPVPPSAQPWRHIDEAELIHLKVDPIAMKETAVAVAANQMARAVANNVGTLDDEVRRSLMDSLQTATLDPQESASASDTGAMSTIL